MKKIISITMAALLLMASFMCVQAADEAKRITSGETVYGSPNSNSWESYAISVYQEGDMKIDIKAKEGVYVYVQDSTGKQIAPYDYKVASGLINKTSDYYYVNYGNDDYGEGTFIYHVEKGDYTVSLKYSGTVSATMTVTAPKAIDVKVNGTLISFDQPPVIVDGRTLVPLRAIFEALGATVDWYSETATVVSKRGNTTIKMTIGSNLMQKDGEDITLDVPAQLINDRTLVPVRAIAEAFGCNVDWDGDAQLVTITE